MPAPDPRSLTTQRLSSTNATFKGKVKSKEPYIAIATMVILLALFIAISVLYTKYKKSKKQNG